MARPSKQNHFLKHLPSSLAILGLVALMATWKPAFSRDSGEASADLRSLSSRVLSSENHEDPVDQVVLNNSPALKVSSDTATPRVSAHDKIAASAKSKVDAADEETHLSVIAAAKKKEASHKTDGIRTRLLIQAAERSLTSPTPWADLSLVALSFKRLGDPKAARYWFDRASRLAFDPDDSIGASQALREVVKNAVAAGFYDIALELISRIPELKEKSRARAELVKAYARKKNFVEAHQLALTLLDTKARGLALRSIAEFEARHQGLTTALQTLQSITDPAEKDRAFGTVAGIRAKMGDSDGALTLLGQITNPRARDATAARIATIQQSGGAVSIEALVGLIYDPTFRDEALLTLISSEASRLGIDVAASSVPRIQTAVGRAKAYESLVRLQIRQGDLDGALARAQSIRSEPARYRSLQAVAVAEVRTNGTTAARRIANLIGDHDLRDSTYGKIAQRAAVYRQPDGAVSTIQYIDDPTERATAFANVALTQARYGQDRAARVLVRDATRELERVESPRDKDRTQGLVAQIFAETGDSTSAFTAAAAITNHRLRDSTYQRVALSFAKISKPAIAAQSAHFIERESTRERALNSVAKTLATKVALTDAVSYAARLDGPRQQVRFLLGVAGRKS